jgi:very-short-patch-repair endonuclease
LVNFFDNPGHGALDALSENLDVLERHARSPRRRGNQPEPYESWFEIDVALELLRRKFAVRSQVEVAGKRIDLVVDGLDARLAVECDGDEWHGPEQYERDMARQRQLERAGWTFVRVRESDFYADRETAAMTIKDACEEMGIRPLDFVEELPLQPPDAAEPDGESDEGSSFGPESPAEQDPENDPAATEMSITDYGPFTGYSEALGFPDPRDSSPANVRAVLRQIIEKDGPLTRSSVCRLYVEGCPGLQRVGRVVRQALNRALGGMLRGGDIVQEDELRDGSPEGQVVRLAGESTVQVRPAGRRDLLEVPASELLAVLRRSAPGSLQSANDDEPLLRTLLEHYGFSRLTKPRREYLSKVLRLLRRPEQEARTAEESR